MSAADEHVQLRLSRAQFSISGYDTTPEPQLAEEVRAEVVTLVERLTYGSYAWYAAVVIAPSGKPEIVGSKPFRSCRMLNERFQRALAKPRAAEAIRSVSR